MIDTIGIDISKAMLDAYWQSGKKHKQFCNTGSGLRALVRWIERSDAALVVFEATGVYHRLLETGLAEHGVPFSMVNPRQARRFAEGTGILAKTDRVDASMLARMGALLEMKADEPTRKIIRDIKDMETARQALIRDRTAAKARLSVATLPLLRRQASLRLRQIERNLAEVDAAIETTIRADTELSRKADILTSIPEIAKVTAFAMLIHMPELGELTGKQAASLGGLAPISRQSASR
jgi:transposase